ncbi:MAG: hypothetical protein ACFFCQ_09085 [Promethearchaeota archaeon]
MITPKVHYTCLVDLKRGTPVLLNGVPFESEETDLSPFIAGFLGTLEHFVQDYLPTGLIIKQNNSYYSCGIGRKDNIALWTMGPTSEGIDPYILHYKLSTLLNNITIEDIQLVTVSKISNKEKKKFFKTTKSELTKKQVYSNRPELARIIGFISDIIAYNVSNCYLVPCRSPIELLSNSFSNSDEKERTTRLFRYEQPLSIMLNMFHAFSTSIFSRIELYPHLIQLRHRWDPAIQMNLHFSPLKENPQLWGFLLTTTSHLAIYYANYVSEQYPAFSLQFSSTDQLVYHLSNLPVPQDFSQFEQEVFKRFGPFSRGGLRGSVPTSEVLKIGTTEGKEETEISAGVRRITSDTTLQEKLIGGLLALEKRNSSETTSD